MHLSVRFPYYLRNQGISVVVDGEAFKMLYVIDNFAMLSEASYVKWPRISHCEILGSGEKLVRQEKSSKILGSGEKLIREEKRSERTF